MLINFGCRWSFPLTSVENRFIGFEIILFSCPLNMTAEYFCFLKWFKETHEDLCIGLFACADLLGWDYYLHLITQHANTTIYIIFQKRAGGYVYALFHLYISTAALYYLTLCPLFILLLFSFSLLSLFLFQPKLKTALTKKNSLC